MLKRRFVSVLLLATAILFSSCSKTPQESFALLKNIEGNWKSTENVIVYDSWKITNDSLVSGRRFSVNGSDTILIENYSLKMENGRFLFEIQKDKKEKMVFPFVKANGKRAVFEQTEYDYPQRIIIGFPKDSVYRFRQENIRGNKPVSFIMKRI